MKHSVYKINLISIPKEPKSFRKNENKNKILKSLNEEKSMMIICAKKK